MGNLQEEQLMPLFAVSRNITFRYSAGFGSFDHGIVFSLLRYVQGNLYRWTESVPHEDRHCFVEYRGNNPQIRESQGQHVIGLHVSGNHWCQWVYQFAHEYCHHMICGNMTGKKNGLFWFEETVCELSSMHNLYCMVRFCETSPSVWLRRFAPAVRDYLGDLLGEAGFLPDCRQFLLRHKDELAQPAYQRSMYSALSATMLPLFLGNPSLWKVILHFGDMSRWASLEVLFRHLHETSDDSYSSSLANLDRLLLG